MNDSRRIKLEKGILDLEKLLCKVLCMAFIDGLIDNADEKLASSKKKKTLSKPNSRLKCNNHTQFEAKLTKIETLL